MDMTWTSIDILPRAFAGCKMAWEWDKQRLMDTSATFLPPSGIVFSYGTAGFRLEASLLTSTVFRVGVLAALRSLATGKVTGLVLTASHNHVSENGVKMVDPAGDMLVRAWEPYADAIANAADLNAFLEVVDGVIKKEHIPVTGQGKVLLARDTRPSGHSLMCAAKKGIEAMKGVVATDMGILTTPQLHWMVRSMNNGEPATEADYFHRFASAFKKLLKLSPNKPLNLPNREIVVDGANGVGASKLQQLQMLIDGLTLQVRNSGKPGEGELNDSVGADYVQKERVVPNGFVVDVGKRCASIDGDADRLVYFYLSAATALHLLDGDKILSLFAYFLKQQLEVLVGRLQPGKNFFLPGYGSLNFGVVQTAYANGASTRYLKERLGLKVVLTPTGVKYLHEEAKKFDVGLYFEANGHGTILFNERFLAYLGRESNSNETQEERFQAMERLLAVSDMVNQAVGDAMSGLLMVETVLIYSGWSIQDWDAMYSDLPSRQLKVKVVDRLGITTRDAETKVARPLELQQAIDTEVGKYEQGRAFVRPSGTEDVVRVYAEAASQESADALASAVARAVHQFAGGVGS